MTIEGLLFGLIVVVGLCGVGTIITLKTIAEILKNK